MILKITGQDKERLDQNLNSFLNLSTMICLKGYIPSPEEMSSPQELGKWWIRETNRFILLPISNDYWLNIREEGENYILVEFRFRYDNDNKKKDSISLVLLAFFDFVENANLPIVKP